MIKTNNKEPWQKALDVLVQLETAQKKLGTYLENAEKGIASYSTFRGYVLNVVKHRRFLEYFLKSNAKKTPKTKLKCFLLLVVGQMWQKYLDNNLSESQMAPLANGWMDRAKEAFNSNECKFINAILRKVFPFFASSENLPLTIRYNTPTFLIERYRHYYGESAVHAYLHWNESFSTVYIRTNEPLNNLKPTVWNNFYTLTEDVCWQDVLSLLNTGKAYIQDPMTRIPIDQLDVQANLNVLDLCSAPGGKTVQIAQKLEGTGCIVSVDLPEHMKRLKLNTKFYTNVHLIGKNVLDLQIDDLKNRHLPVMFDRVLIDVPCSNTGVVRRKPDVLARLTPKDFAFLPKLQLELLNKACLFVNKGGLLVYSTCSIDPEENEGVINTFLKQHKNFSLQTSHVSLPWIENHDGGGSFCLRKS